MNFQYNNFKKHVSPELIKALESENSDFSGKKSGDFQIIADKNCITVRKIQSIATKKEISTQEGSSAPKTETLLKGERLDKAINTVVDVLNEEIQRIQGIAITQCIAGQKVQKSEGSYRVSR